MVFKCLGLFLVSIFVFICSCNYESNNTQLPAISVIEKKANNDMECSKICPSTPKNSKEVVGYIFDPKTGSCVCETRIRP